MKSSSLLLLGIWLAGLASFVPVLAVRLIFWAPREEYPLLITLILFWLFGYWSIVGPAAVAWRLYRIVRALRQSAASRNTVQGPSPAELEGIGVALLEGDQGVPRPLARWIVALVRRNLEKQSRQGAPSEEERLQRRL